MNNGKMIPSNKITEAEKKANTGSINGITNEIAKTITTGKTEYNL
jgi:hypothetical protein